MQITRRFKFERISGNYTDHPGWYLVRSIGVLPMFGPFPTVVCYVVRTWRGYRRFWLQ